MRKPRRYNHLSPGDVDMLITDLMARSVIAEPQVQQYPPEPEPERKPHWRDRFFGPDGAPLPPDYTRVEIATGNKIE